MLVILALRILRQEDSKFEANLVTQQVPCQPKQQSHTLSQKYQKWTGGMSQHLREYLLSFKTVEFPAPCMKALGNLTSSSGLQGHPQTNGHKG